MNLIILENIKGIDDIAYQQWINNYASSTYDDVEIIDGFAHLSEDELNKIIKKIAKADALSFHSSLSNGEQNEMILNLLSSLDEIPKIYISYIHYNKLTWYLNNEFKGSYFKLREILKTLIEKHPGKFFEITYEQVNEDGNETYFKNDIFDFESYELISSSELDYITHKWRTKKSSKNQIIEKFKKEIIHNLKSTLDVWGYGEANIEDITNEIKNFKSNIK